MRKKDEIKLDALSQIDDDILEKNTQKRNRLMGRNCHPIGRIAAIAACLAAVTIIGAFMAILIPTLTKQIPIYTGMSVSSTSPFDAVEERNIYSFDMLSKGNDNDDGNKSVEDIVDAAISVSGTDEEMYYAKPNQDIYITLHINNPDNFVILSFTLNGKVYSSYMFEEGSDMENIVLKYNVGDIAGMTEYTVDAIKYVDGKEIKDVIMEGDRTVKVGIHSEDQPAPAVTDETVGINAFSAKVFLSDKHDLIRQSGGEIYAVICRGEELIEYQKIESYNATVYSFGGLLTDTEYTFAIVAMYDNLDGSGFGTHSLYEKSFRTQSIVGLDKAESTQDGLNFSLVWNEEFAGKHQLDKIEIVKEGEIVKTLPSTDTSVSGLLSNSEYEIVLYYTNDGSQESAKQAFRTLAKDIPTVEVTQGDITQTSFTFNVAVTDVDGVGAISKIELIHGEDVTSIDDLTTREIADLLSDNDYRLQLTYTYDLNDGTVAHDIVVPLDVKTQAKTVPAVEVTEGDITQTSFTFNVAVTDVDGVGAITKIELIHGEEVTNIDDLTTREIADLLSDNDYRLQLTYTYDLNDGTGAHDIVVPLDVKTQAKAVPEIEITTLDSGVYDVKGSYSLSDTDSVITSAVKVELLNGNALVKSADTKEFSFAELDSYTYYNVKVSFTYDLNDGVGEQTMTVEKSIQTKPYLSATGYTILNTSAVYEGDIIYLKINVDNPSKVAITSVTVNGADYATVGASNGSSVNVEITNEGQFNGGRIQLTVESLNVGDYRSTVAGNLSDDIFIYGSITAEKIEWVNEDLEIINWAFPSDKVYVKVTFDNPTGYEILSINGNTEITKIDDEHYYFAMTENEYEKYYYNLSEISYSSTADGSGTPISVVTNLESWLLSLDSDEIRYISSAEELMSISGKHYYELTCDIDLSGINWQPINNISGVLNGKGYAIKNMSFVGNSTKTGFGLVETLYGVITDLDFENTTFIINYNGSANEIAYGIVAGSSNAGAIIKNCVVDETSSITLSGVSDTCAIRNIGGIIGSSSNLGGGSVINCTFKGTVTDRATSDFEAAASFTYTGGIAGEAGGNIIYCTNYGEVSSIGTAGGIIGSAAREAEISNCLNYGNVTGTRTVGGIGGSAQGHKAIIKNCKNLGSVSGGSHVGNIAGYEDGYTIINDEIFIYGSITAEKVEFVNEHFEPIDWSLKNKAIYVKVTLNNPTGYELVSINGDSNITKIDNNTYYLSPATSYSRELVFELTEFKYKDPLDPEGKPLTASASMRPASVIFVDSPIYISTAEELMAIGYEDPDDIIHYYSEYAYYVLSNDIDLSGISWTPLNVKGVFNGNGKTIKNMSFVGATDKGEYGLFGYFEGIITDLNIEGASFIINGNGYPYDYKVSCGAIVGTAQNFKMKNCTVDETSSIRYTFSGRGILAVGGMVGQIVNSSDVPDNKIENCYCYCSEIIVNSTTDSRIGGIVGIYSPNWSEDLIVYNCNSTSNISGNTDSIGEIVGTTNRVNIIK